VHPRLSIWAPLPPTVYLRRPRRRLPFPLHEPNCRVVAWARHGIWHGVRQLGLGEGDEVLTPAWHHGSEVEAFERAGLTCRFYDCGDSREPDPAALEALLGPRVRALHLTHALGFPLDGGRWREWCDERGLFLLEDAAQAWLAAQDGTPVGSHGHLAVFCLYKTFGLPEGAAMIQAEPPPPVGLDRRLGAAPLARRHGMWMAGRSALFYRAVRPFRRAPKPYDPLRDFELRDPQSAPWLHTPFVLRRVVDPAAAARRRDNYRVLLQGLGDLVLAPFADLPDGASPFVFPIATRAKEGVLAGLREQGISALDLWSVPHPSLPVGDFPCAAERRATVLGLPVHQELRAADLERIVAAVSASAGTP
jgi:dTDP-4-amino-4,6-dideoxygalactose transaminase